MNTIRQNPLGMFATGAKYAIGLLLAFWALFPIFWMVTAGFKKSSSLLQLPPDFIVFTPTLANYSELLIEDGFLQYLTNSLLVATVAVTGSVILGVPAAYALSRMKIPAKQDVGFWILSTRMIPPLAIIVPLYLFYTSFGMTRGLWGLIITNFLITLPMIIWIVKGFIDELPESLEESAMVDGCTRVQAFVEVVVPLVKPGIIAAAFIGFIFSWNEYVLALVLTGGDNKTAPLQIQSAMGYLEIDWGLLGAAATITIIPPVVLSMLIRNHLVEGMTMGAVKE